MSDLNYIKNHLSKIIAMTREAESSLKSARSWGIYDIFAGEGLSSLLKHNKISKTEKQLREIDYELESLKKELSQLKLTVNSEISTSTINKFMDIFMDNIFSDWITQTKINKGLEEIQELRYNLESILREIDRLS